MIIIIQQRIILSGETISPTRLLFQYMNSLSKSDRIKVFIATKITDLIIFFDNHGKLAV